MNSPDLSPVHHHDDASDTNTVVNQRVKQSKFKMNFSNQIAKNNFENHQLPYQLSPINDSQESNQFNMQRTAAPRVYMNSKLDSIIM